MSDTEKVQQDHSSVEKSLENGPDGPEDFVVRADDRYHFDAADLDRVQRRLQQRHVQMYVRIFSNMSSCD